MIDYYEILEVSPKASKEVIQNAYRILAKRWHPDGKAPLDIVECERQMKLLNEAKAILLDDLLRARFDRERLSDQNVNSFNTGTQKTESSVKEPAWQNIVVNPQPQIYKNEPPYQPIQGKRVTRKQKSIFIGAPLLIVFCLALYFVGNFIINQSIETTAPTTRYQPASTYATTQIAPVGTTQYRSSNTDSWGRIIQTVSPDILNSTSKSFALNYYSPDNSSVSVLNADIHQIGKSLSYNFEINNTSDNMLSIKYTVFFSNKNGVALFQKSGIETAFSRTGSFEIREVVQIESMLGDFQVDKMRIELQVVK